MNEYDPGVPNPCVPLSAGNALFHSPASLIQASLTVFHAPASLTKISRAACDDAPLLRFTLGMRQTRYQMSPSAPPDGPAVETVRAPRALVPTVTPLTVLVRLPVTLFEASDVSQSGFE